MNPFEREIKLALKWEKPTFRAMSPATLIKDLEIDPKRVGRPRLDPYQRLLGRFYEQLFLLNALGQTRGDHATSSFELDASRTLRRRFLQNLCFICDFKKGGSTCTAIGLEELDTHYNFCVASNNETDKIAAFLQNVLNILRVVAHENSTNDACTESKFFKLCIEFTAERIKEEGNCLRRNARDCLSKVIGQHAGSGSRLVEWLQTAIGFDDHFGLCKFAHNNRHSDSMNEISSRGWEEEKRSGSSSRRSSFALVQHYIGRLSHHIRAIEELLRDSFVLSPLLDNHAVCKISAPSAVPPPIRDSHTNLRSILNRMFANNDREKSMIEDRLLYLDKVAGIFKNFLRPYYGSLPEVHAEIQVLEYLFKRQTPFVDDDRFIACSKPACLCCELYLKYHPARVMVYSSHRKIWTKWSPPLVEQFSKENPAARQQMIILNKMTQDLREQVITHILQRLPPNRWHPDSITNITDIRESGISSDSLEVVSAETLEARPSAFSQIYQNRSNGPPGTEISEIPEEEIHVDDGSDSENGGVYLCNGI